MGGELNWGTTVYILDDMMNEWLAPGHGGEPGWEGGCNMITFARGGQGPIRQGHGRGRPRPCKKWGLI